MGLRPGYKRTEVGEIPDDWNVQVIGELTLKVGSGITPTGGNRVYRSHGRPFLRSQNIGWGSLLLADVVFVSDSLHSTFADTEITDGDVFLNITGASIGRSSVADARVLGGNVNQHVCIIRADQTRLVPSYLNCVLLSSIGQGQINSFQAGGNRQGLNFSQVRSIRLPLPPIAEQRAIAEALADMDALLGGLDRLIAKKRDLKQATMQQLLTGQTRLPGFSDEWVIKHLRDIAEIRSGGTPSTADNRFWNGSIPWCTPTDITALGGHKYLNSTARCITQAGLESGSTEWIPAGSVIMTSRATIGECAISRVPLTTNQGFKNFVPHESTDLEFLYYLLSTQKQGFVRLCGGSTFLEIGKAQLLEYAVRLPNSKEEQAAIATVLSDMDAEITALEARRGKTSALKQGMMQELLTGRTRLI